MFQPPHFQKMLEYVGSMKQYHIATTRSPVLTEIILKFSNFDITKLVTSMLSQVHDIYQTNPAFKKKNCLGILCFNTVNQWKIITQSSCREEMEK